MENYPDAKVILTVRDPEKWYRSVYETIFQISRSYPKWFLLFSPKRRQLNRLVEKGVYQRIYNGKFEDREYAINVFKKHIEEVKKTVPADKLLVYQVQQGWEPLCEFLGVPVPEDEPFPRSNESEQMKKMLRQMRFFFKSVEIGLGLLIIIGVLGIIWSLTSLN